MERKNNKYNFFIDFFENNKFPNCYSQVEFIKNSNILSLKNNSSTNVKLKNLRQIHLVPNYLELRLRHNYSLIQIPQSNKGYGIILKDYNDIDSYVRDQFKKDSKKILGRLKRLHHCFEIKFVVFNRDITDEEYSTLMNRLKDMLERRFKQRGDQNKKLENWDSLYSRTLYLLKAKKASLFVIYHGLKPIQITLLYHMQNILMSAIPAYDIDYKKFGLGNIGNYKKVEWCIKNGIDFIELGYGDLEYKRRWSNKIYNYNTHIVYNPNRLYTRFYSHLLYIKYSVKEYLKKKEIKESYRRYFSFFNKKIKIQETNQSIIPNVEKLSKFPHEEEKTLINIEEDNNRFLRKSVYDFQYISFAPSESVTVYQSNKMSSSFIITDKNKSIRITF